MAGKKIVSTFWRGFLNECGARTRHPRPPVTSRLWVERRARRLAVTLANENLLAVPMKNKSTERLYTTHGSRKWTNFQ